MDSSIISYIRAFGVRWFVTMSGPLSVPLAVIAYFVQNDAAKIILFTTALLCAVFASYWVWKVEREARIDAESIRLFAQCDLVPPTIIVPIDGRIYMLQINAIPASAGGGGLGISSGGPGEKIIFPFQSIYRCKITNYASIPLFKMSIALHLTFMEAVKDSAANTSLSSGAVTIDRDWPLEIPKIDPGKDSSFAFYMLNMSTQFVRVMLPVRVSFMAGLDGQRKSADLIQTTT